MDSTLTISGIGPGNQQVESNSQVTWNTNEDATKSLSWDFPSYCLGTLSFGIGKEVYVDRGDMSNGNQWMYMNATANSEVFTQTENGGSVLLSPEQFIYGGIITLVFYPPTI